MNRKPYFDSTEIFYGRGFVQVTWYENYKKLTKANDKGWDFFSNPSLLLELVPSAWAMVYGMKNGLFTGKKLSTFIQQNDLKKNDFINARKVVNGLDKAEKIAEYTQTFKNALL
jgi:predicted chitinase